jgi:acyl carrier protein
MKTISNEVFSLIISETFRVNVSASEVMLLKIGDFEEWDSLGNFNLLLAVEDYFKVKFSLDDFEKLDSIKKISDILIERSN